MKTENQIKDKISQLEQEVVHWQEMQNKYKWLSHEKEKGSETYGMYQAKEFETLSKINLLKWVLIPVDKGLTI